MFVGIARVIFPIALLSFVGFGQAARADAPAAVAVIDTSVSGTVTDSAGAPIAGAAVTLKGPAVYKATTDEKGAFSLPHVVAGLYEIAVTKPGYNAAVEGNLAVFIGEPQQLTVHMDRATFSSLRTIASVRVAGGGGGSINTSAASVNVVTAQAFVDQGQPQVTRVLSQVPGLQISFPSNSSNAAAPGAITIPNIRGAASYETASLIDGHPISVGQYGDNVTTFLSTYMFGQIEVIKGPGADAPVVNNAIGGTTNFRTKDPTLTPEADVMAGFDNHGGTLSNISVSDTNGRLGYILDIATSNNPSALNGHQLYYDPSFGTYNGGTLSGNNTTNPAFGGTESSLTTGYSLVACCNTLFGNLDQTAELLKFRYKLSSATTATVSYLGGQAGSDQTGNTSDLVNAQFLPTDPAYSGAVKPGPIQLLTNFFPGTFSGETNNEPILQAEVSSTIGKDAVLARYYHATIERYQYQGSNASALDFNNVTLYGNSSGFPTFNGTAAAVGSNDFYQEPESDKLAGVSFEYQHPLGNNDLLSFSADRTNAQSVDYIVSGGPSYFFNIPPGTTQTLTTYLLRGHFYLGPKLEATLSDYVNTYSSTYLINCPAGNCNNYQAAAIGTGATFQTTNKAHTAPRLGRVFRPRMARKE